MTADVLVVGDWAPEHTALRDTTDLDRLGAEFLLGRRATVLDRNASTVALEDGTELASRTLVIATGLTPRKLPGTSDLARCDVTVVDPLPTPMHRQLGPVLGSLPTTLHGGHGVRMLAATPVRRLVGRHGRVTAVELHDEVLPADVVVVTIGSVPATGRLDGSGL